MVTLTRLAVLAALPLLAACGGADDDGTVLVFAAASLTDVFTEMAAAAEAAEPGLDVELSFSGSSALREQVLDGAPADVIATANRSVLDELVEAGATRGTPEVFAVNELRLAVPEGNPAGVSALVDLADPDLLVGVCAEQVPCGALAREAFALAGVQPSIDTEEGDVRALLARIADGELDAGLVYATDIATAEGRVEAIDDVQLGVVAEYPIAVLAESSEPDDAERFIAFVRTDRGQRILAAAGFGLP